MDLYFELGLFSLWLIVVYIAIGFVIIEVFRANQKITAFDSRRSCSVEAHFKYFNVYLWTISSYLSKIIPVICNAYRLLGAILLFLVCLLIVSECGKLTNRSLGLISVGSLFEFN